MATRRVDIGPTGDEVRTNVRRLRETTGESLRGLSEDMSRHGRPMSMQTLSQIETGGRRVDVDDLVALSVALGVMPNALLLPHDARDGQVANVTGLGEVNAAEVWDWAEGRRPSPYAPGAEGTVDLEEREAVAFGFRMLAEPRGRYLGVRFWGFAEWLLELEPDEVTEEHLQVLLERLREWQAGPDGIR